MTVLNHLEDHFSRTGEWFALCLVFRVKIALRLSLHRRGWV